MKKLIILILTILTQLSLIAQSSDQNYVQTKKYQVPSTTSLSDSSQVNETIQYFDGLGRPTQVVQKGMSPDGNDIISQIVYDGHGRVSRQYLPFEKMGSGSGDGSYNDDWLVLQNNFYTDTHPYSQTNYEPSPLGRVSKELPPGEDWVGASGDGIGRGFSYSLNTPSDNVQRFEIDLSGSLVYRAAFSAGDLFKTTSLDEADNESEVFTNNRGQTILKKSIIDDNSTALTYYIYDYFDQLRYVIQPEGVKELQEAATPYAALAETDFLNRWAFQYNYDQKRRMIAKKVPGGAWTMMVYDQRDRLVLTRDGNQPDQNSGVIIGRDEPLRSLLTSDEFYSIGLNGSVTLEPGFGSDGFDFYAGPDTSGKWSFTKYDSLDRPVMTGEIHLDGNRETLQAEIDGIQNYNYGVSYIGNMDLFGYNNSSYPQVTSSEVYTVTYYDTYAFLNLADYADTEFHPLLYNTEVIGQATGGQVRVLGGDMLQSAVFYDNRLRPIDEVKRHQLNGFDVTHRDYKSVVDNSISIATRQHTADVEGNGTIDINKDISEDFNYDHAGRLVSHTITIDGDQTSKTQIAQTYDGIGQLIQKDLGDEFQLVDYAYNIRGWLTSINNGINLSNIENDKFGMSLEYNLNGNIRKMDWRTNTTTTIGPSQSYDYAYDGLNRLKKASYNGGQFDVGGTSGSLGDEIGYDLNGNIKSLTRKKDGTLIDNLTYSYQENSVLTNRLNSVADNADDTQGFDEVSNGAVADEYQYDNNGNLTRDLNKGISNITYNYLNLPASVTTSTGVVNYTYDAHGNKLTKEKGGVYSHYISGIHYIKETGENQIPVLKFMQHSEGRYNFVNTENEYDLKDHLGNVRATVKGQGTIPKTDSWIDAPQNCRSALIEEIVIVEDISEGTVNVQFEGKKTTGFSTGAVVKLLHGSSLLGSRTITSGFGYTTFSFLNISLSGSQEDLVLKIETVVDGTDYDICLQNMSATHTYSVPNVEVIQTDDYYPFGLTFNHSGGGNNYKFNGKEEQGGTGWYDFGARMYMADIGRWGVVDPMADKAPGLTPYRFGFNNPISNIDPDGMFEVSFGNVTKDSRSLGFSVDISGSFSSSSEASSGSAGSQGGSGGQNKSQDNSPSKGEAKVNPDTDEVQTTEEGGLDWQGGLEAAVQAFVPFGDMIYPPEENGIISATMPDLPIGPGGAVKGVKGGYTVYRAIAKNGKTYWGMTKNFAQRVRQHAGRFIDDPVEIYKNIPTRGAARGIEQMMIDATKGGLNSLDNVINSIGKNNPKMMQYYQEAVRYLNGL